MSVKSPVVQIKLKKYCKLQTNLVRQFAICIILLSIDPALIAANSGFTMKLTNKSVRHDAS